MLRNHISDDIEHFKPSTYRPGLCNSEFTGFISTNLILIISLIKLKIPLSKNGFYVNLYENEESNKQNYLKV